MKKPMYRNARTLDLQTNRTLAAWPSANSQTSPPQSSAMSTHFELDSSYGAAYIGMVVSTVLYGVTCVQAFYYYTNQNDRWYIKHLVTAVMVFDTVHQALTAQIVYTYTITDWGDPASFGVIIWSLVGEIIFCGLIAFIVQSFLTLRIWRLSRRNIYLTGVPAILVAGSFVILLVYFVESCQFERSPELLDNKGLTTSITLLNTVVDLLIAAILCILLNTSRTGFHQTEVKINKLIVLTVNTGLIPSLCALGAFIAAFVDVKAFIYVAFLLCLGRLYTVTLLATLNSREIIRNVNQSWNASLPLRDFHTNGSNQTPNVSIKIDTTTETYRHGNDQIREEKPGISKPHAVC